MIKENFKYVYKFCYLVHDYDITTTLKLALKLCSKLEIRFFDQFVLKDKLNLLTSKTQIF